MNLVKTCLLVSLLGACAVDGMSDDEAEETAGDYTAAQAGAPTASPPRAEATPPGDQAAGPLGMAVANQGWVSEAFAAPGGSTLQVEIRTKVHEPSYQPVDMVLGLARGPADAFSDLAAIVRFNPSGYVDARNGGVYQSVSGAWRFKYDHLYAVRFVVDFATHRYSAYIRTYDTPGPGDPIALNYAFRTEQATTNVLDNFSSIVDSSTGSLVAWVHTVGP